MPPTIIALDRASDLKEEVFGPILHVVRWRADELDALLDELAGNGYALTLGIHSRIDATVERIVARLPHGNVYVNRNMIGAVVGTQPFGGTGLSGTGPKAGGPDYLRRFCTEQTVTINTAAAGGNASLLTAEELMAAANAALQRRPGIAFFAVVNTIWPRIGLFCFCMSDSIERLHEAVLAAKDADPAVSRTARLLRSGRAKMAKKLAEEAVEVVIDAMHGQTEAVIKESADLIYNLVVLWVAAGVEPKDVWAEMKRRERLLGIAEKLPKNPVDLAARRKVVALDSRRARKRR